MEECILSSYKENILKESSCNVEMFVAMKKARLRSSDAFDYISQCLYCIVT